MRNQKLKDKNLKVKEKPKKKIKGLTRKKFLSMTRMTLGIFIASDESILIFYFKILERGNFVIFKFADKQQTVKHYIGNRQRT